MSYIYKITNVINQKSILVKLIIPPLLDGLNTHAPL